MKASLSGTLRMLALIFICAYAVPSHSLAAQTASGKSVIIVVPDEFPSKDARALIIRDLRQEDVIAIDRQSATPDGLIAAMSLLQQMRAEPMPAGASTVVVSITGFVVATTPSADNAGKAAALLARLLARESVNVGNLGRGRWLRLDELKLGT